MDELTARELEILKCFAIGMKRAEIAQKMGIRPKTVQCYLTTIFQKTGVIECYQAVAWYFEHQVLAPDQIIKLKLGV